MATVYKAQDTILKRYVAVKVLREEFTTDEEFIKRFNTEAQSAASLTHPNIVSIYDVGTENNIYYIVMELIQGKTLKEIIDEDGVLPWKWALNVATQIASALEVAHKNNIVHRDIKPHNIIITEDGVAKVTDFGIAKAVSNSTITAFGTTIGSVHYFSPEHARGGFTDAKSDLYSLGVVMYEMLTGRVPFDADTAVSIALKHMQEKPIEPIKLNPSIPYSVNKIIMKAMEKDLNLRYQSATEMLKDLNMALKDPEGDFVKTGSNEMAYTQRIDIPEEALNDNQERNRNSKKKKGKIRKFFEEHPAAKIITIILAVILIPVICFFGAQAILSIGSVEDVPLPNFVNMTREEAENTASEAGLQLEISEEFNSDVEAGKVISQDPPYLDGYTVKENSTVKIVISKGENIKIVPKVIGETVDSATELLKAEELEIEVIEEASSTVEAGIIIRQEPEADTELNAGETVKVYVSTGTKQITMVNVVGEKESDAKQRLTELGFEVDIVYEEDTSKENGVVLRQTINEGETVDDGSKVILYVNQIVETKEVNVIVDLKSITGGYTEPEEGEDGGSSTVNINVNGKTRTGVSKNESAYSEITLSGKDGEELEIKITITDPSTGDTIYSDSTTVILGEKDSVTFR
jgi:serine/threonine protein kinase